MTVFNLNGWLYRMCEWITRLVYLNLLWIGFSLLGLLLFGVGPATSSMFTIIRKWVLGQEDVKVFQTFWKAYKQDFWKANLLTLFLIAGGSLLYIDFIFISNLEGWLTSVLSGLLVLLLLLYIVTLVYIFPVFVHFQLKPIQYIKFAILFGLSSPLSMLIIVISALFMYYLTIFIPSILPFFSGSVVSFVIMQRAQKSFSKIENRYSTS